MESTETPPRPSTAKLILGVAVIAAGVLYTLRNFDIIRLPNIWRLWPLILIGAGLANLRRQRRLEEAFGGWLLVVVGALFLLRNIGVIHASLWAFWPLIFVVIGARIVMGALSRSRTAPPGMESAGSTLNDWVAFGGIERRITAQDFKGGSLFAFCGGFEVDLTQASISGERAVVDVFVWWGGGDIRVPPDWNVVIKVLPLFGGVEDKTFHSVPEEGKPVKELLLTGTAVMGGLEIKN